MPNGRDKNFWRLCATIDGFRFRHRAWPDTVRMDSLYVETLRKILTAEAFAVLTAKVGLVEEVGAFFIAEDAQGRRFEYGEELPDDFSSEKDMVAQDWLGVMPKPEWRD